MVSRQRHHRHRRLALLLCGCLAWITLAAAVAATAPAEPVGSLELVESVPLETVYDLPELPQAADVWRSMIGAARRTVQVESFYFSDDPDDADDPLDRVLGALRAAANRGVAVELLGDRGFARTYPQIPATVAGWPGAASRLLDARSRWGGIQHAKFMVVDGREFFVGSQNWDWRALSQIRELGARVRCEPLARALQAIFATDWALAAGEEPPAGGDLQPGPWLLTTPYGGPVSVRLAASPPGGLPDGIPHDLPLLVGMIDRAERRLRLQLLSYSPRGHGGDFDATLDDALRRAAARGVQVQIILSNWAKRRSQLPYVKSLAVLENIEVRFSNIPPWSGGFVPFARVEHCKYLVKDEDEAWLGTANWAPDYFAASRNVSLLMAGESVAGELNRFFEKGWNGPYVETVDPCRDYRPPRRKE